MQAKCQIAMVRESAFADHNPANMRRNLTKRGPRYLIYLQERVRNICFIPDDVDASTQHFPCPARRRLRREVGMSVDPTPENIATCLEVAVDPGGWSDRAVAVTPR